MIKPSTTEAGWVPHSKYTNAWVHPAVPGAILSYAGYCDPPFEAIRANGERRGFDSGSAARKWIMEMCSSTPTDEWFLEDDFYSSVSGFIESNGYHSTFLYRIGDGLGVSSNSYGDGYMDGFGDGCPTNEKDVYMDSLTLFLLLTVGD